MRFAGTVAAVCMLASCAFDATPRDGARIACVSDADCPATWRCARGAFVCAHPGGPCVDNADGEIVAAPDGAPCGEADDGRVCIAARCVLSACGDGVVDARAGEACDDGAANDDARPDACRTDCAAAACGDGVVDAPESCDGVAASGRACELCVASCPMSTGRCDDADESCACSVTVIADSGLSFEALFTIAVDDTFVYWFRDANQLERVPRVGGASEIVTVIDDAVAAVDLQADLQADQQVEDDALWFITIDDQIAGPIPILRRFHLATGALATVTPAAAFALGETTVWAVAFGLASIDRETLALTERFVPDVFAFVAVAATGDVVVVADESGSLWAFETASDAPPTLIAERRFQLKGLRRSGDAVTWWNGADLEVWRPGDAAPATLPRLSDGQLGLEVRDFTIDGGVAYAMIGELSDRRPGGIMVLREGETAWRMAARTVGYRLRVTPEAFFYSGSGVLRFDRE